MNIILPLSSILQHKYDVSCYPPLYHPLHRTTGVLHLSLDKVFFCFNCSLCDIILSKLVTPTAISIIGLTLIAGIAVLPICCISIKSSPDIDLSVLIV